jgi:hypothetical protein
MRSTVMLLVLVLPVLAFAQAADIGSVSALVGEARVSHIATPGPAPLRLHDGVFLKDRIETQERSVVRVLFGGRMTVTVRELSVLTVTDDPARAKGELDRGKLALQADKNGLRPGESVEIYTPNAIVGIRGSVVVAEVTGAVAAPESTITVLEAHHTVTIAPRSDPSKAVPLKPRQSVKIPGPRLTARVEAVRHISRQQAKLEGETAEVPKNAGRQAREPRAGHRERDLRPPGPRAAIADLFER